MMFPKFDKLIREEFTQNCALMSSAGFSDAPAAVESLLRLREASKLSLTDDLTARHRTVPDWFKTLKRILREAPAPETILSVIDQYVSRSGQELDAIRLFEESPRSLETLARLACSSPFLTQILFADPEALLYLTIHRRTAEIKSRDDFFEDAMEELGRLSDSAEQLQRLRLFQKRELLRIGICDAVGLLDLKVVTLQLSLLADAMVQVCLTVACQESGIDQAPFSVLALGKLGGEELNYSSDIDLILIAEHDSTVVQQVARRMVEGLSDNLATGFLYRVDLRLRPWGDAGPLVSTPDAYRSYLKNDAQLWERQALLKARLIAGDVHAGTELLRVIRPDVFNASPQEVRDSIQAMKSRIEAPLRRSGKLTREVKLGAGSIRDIEFLVQSLQMIHGAERPEVVSANTLDALVRLAETGLINASTYRHLREGYVFLRTIEHALQLLHNQQIHMIPADQQQRYWLARRLDYPDGDTLLARFEEHRRTVRNIFDEHFGSSGQVAVKAEHPGSSSGIGDDADIVVSSTGRISAGLSQEQLDEIFATLSEDLCVQVIVREDSTDGAAFQVVVCALDCPGLLSIVCAVLFANRLDIRTGFVNSGVSSNPWDVTVGENCFLAVLNVSEANGTGAAIQTARSQQDLARRLQSVLAEFLISQRAGEHDEVRRQLIDLFCERLKDLSAMPSPTADLQINLREHADGIRTNSTDVVAVEITGDDSFGFLFELANALAICQFRIRSAELNSAAGRVDDVVHVVNFDGTCPTGHARLEELKTAVTLIKQFTHWLPSNSAPHDALLRFRDLLHRILSKAEWQDDARSLSQPKVLRAVAQVLGMSRFLWEDLLNTNHDELFPLLTRTDELAERVTREDLNAELQSLLAEAESGEQALNAFKDRHLFRIDLRHVLGHCRPFGAFSEEITELAEIVVVAAADIAWHELIEAHGLPLKEDGTVCAYTLIALGKFGGVEMGFASDIELFLVYEAACRTRGRQSLSSGSFFERLVTRISQIISARHAGIFEVDLRMKPYGQAGSPAVQLSEFVSYYLPEGDAWPYERQALVKMRCLAGDAEFAKTVQQAGCQTIYDSQRFDFDAMRGMREKQNRQLIRGGTINAKLSEGGLVDCEYAVQALQLTFGRRHPRMQTPNTLTALQVATDLGIISAESHSEISEAYMFLRELIDCLRMVRGSAHDLTIPAVGSTEYEQLDRRMELVHDSKISLGEFETQMQIVSRFRSHVETICTQPQPSEPSH
jgi:glutamate-ammonia-ligase adenylyltransferase